MVRRDVLAEHHERRLAIAARQIAEQLIVGAILLDDVDDVLDERRDRRLAAEPAAGAAGRDGGLAVAASCMRAVAM